MSALLKTKSKGGLLRRYDIIEAILNSDFEGVKKAIEEDAYCVNSVHEPSNMNAPMLSSAGRLPEFLDEILKAGSIIDFGYRDDLGNDLLDAAMQSADHQIVEKVQAAFQQFAPHIINNWPEP